MGSHESLPRNVNCIRLGVPGHGWVANPGFLGGIVAHGLEGLFRCAGQEPREDALREYHSKNPSTSPSSRLAVTYEPRRGGAGEICDTRTPLLPQSSPSGCACCTTPFLAIARRALAPKFSAVLEEYLGAEASASGPILPLNKPEGQRSGLGGGGVAGGEVGSWTTERSIASTGFAASMPVSNSFSPSSHGFLSLLQTPFPFLPLPSIPPLSLPTATVPSDCSTGKNWPKALPQVSLLDRLED